MAAMPYQAGYAKSGRAECKGCKENIYHGDLRFGVKVQSPFHDGKQLYWHHEECFFKRLRPVKITEISYFNKLKPDDQTRVKAIIDNNNGIVMPEEEKTAMKRAAEGSSASTRALKDFRVEYSKNNQADCRRCQIKICKAEVRICKTVFNTEVGIKYGGEPLWYHVRCFAQERAELLFFAGGASLPGFSQLPKEDQAMVAKEIKAFNSDAIPVKKLKAEPDDEAQLQEYRDKKKKIEEQNYLFHEHRRALLDLKTQDFKHLLEENSQAVLVGRDECLDLLADIMLFGALEPCPECNQGQLVLDTCGYRCTGYITEWTTCCYVTQEPKREPMIIPDSYVNIEPFTRFRPIADVRLFTAEPRSGMVVVKGEKKESKNIPIPPLKNLQLFLYGKLSDEEETKKRILKLGGLVVRKLTDTTVAVVSTRQDLDRMNKKMKQIKEKDIMVIEESFLDKVDLQTGTIADSLDLIGECNIAEWGADPASKVPEAVLKGNWIRKSGSMYVPASSSKTVKLKIKGGTAVDPDSGLVDIAHVYVDACGAKYTAALCQTDVAVNKNSYYILQLLETDDGKKYYLFRSWGKIATKIGGTKREKYVFKDDAVHQFENLYMEKTGNIWQCRETFEKFPGRYYPVDVDYGETNCKALEVDHRSELPMPVQKLMTIIFDTNTMRKTLHEFELDTGKMPLGKLSKKQIKDGYTVLTQILKSIETGAPSYSEILDATNRFFTMIPHDFGTQKAPLLDNVELVKKKAEMLDNLLEIEIAYSLLKSDEEDTTTSIESYYKKLKTEIVPLDRDSDEFKMLAEYTKNTHAATHSNYTLEIQEVFKVVRAGEEERYEPFKKLHNRRLLWHGTRVTNFAGILSQGLRIKPPEAPETGSMFGNGIYFADMVSKSANYCCTSKSNPTGLLLLCETALGNMEECHAAAAETIKLPLDKHSVWGVGHTQPHPAGCRTLACGTLVPMGEPYQTEKQTALQHNEFIVYDVAQVNMKYLLQMKFNYNTALF